MADINFPKPTEAVENEKISKVITATIDDVAIFDGNGNIADSNKTLGKSVPSDAVFTDTTYGVVTKSSAGLCPVLPNESSTSKYLRQDGSWVSPPNDNTTYSFSNNFPTLAWSTTSTIGTVGGTALTVTMPANPNTNTTYAFSNNAPTLAWNTTSTVGVCGGTALTVKMPANPNTTYAFSNSGPTLAWNTTSTIGTVGGVALTVKMPANPNTNTTYSFSNSAPTLAWNTTSTVGVVGGVALTVKMPANPNTNTTYAFTDKSPTLAWGTKSTVGVAGGTAFTVTMPSNPNTNTTYAFTNKAPTLAWNTTSTVGVAGGVAFTVKMPANPDTNTNTTYSFTDKSPTLAWGTKSTVGVAGGVAFTVTMPGNPNTNTWRGIQNNLNSTSTSDSLSAAMGRELKNSFNGCMKCAYATVNPNSSVGLDNMVDAVIFVCFYHNGSYSYANMIPMGFYGSWQVNLGGTTFNVVTSKNGPIINFKNNSSLYVWLIALHPYTY